MHFENALGEIYQPNSYLTFDDVLLKPQKSPFNSRNDPNIVLNSFVGEIPIISANMDTVTGLEMAKAMNDLGGLGILHRFYKDINEYKSVICDAFANLYRSAFSIGCGDKWIDFVDEVLQTINSATKPIICLDVAHGHMMQSLQTVEILRNKFNAFIIAGNVATADGAEDLVNAGAHAVKVGVGSGSVCTTRIVTGHGIPQLSAIMNVHRALSGMNTDCFIIADGGIRNSGDIVKALAAGADAVMLGNLLAGCDETPGEIFSIKDGSFKMYRGQSSRHFLKDIGKIGVAAEGEAIEIRAKGPTKNIIDELVGGIRSGLTYSGCGTIKQLQDQAVFVEISHHGYVESTPHAFNRLH